MTTNTKLNKSTKEVEDEVEAEPISFKSRMETIILKNKNRIDSLKQEVKELENLLKSHESDMKKPKKTKKLDSEWSYRKPSGLVAPVEISNDLNSFLVKTKAVMRNPDFTPSSKEEQTNWPKVNVKNGSMVSRSDVISHIHKYIKDNNLKKTDPSEIAPDAALKKLFSEPTELSDKSDEKSRKIYGYRSFHRCLNHHFPDKKT